MFTVLSHMCARRKSLDVKLIDDSSSLLLRVYMRTFHISKSSELHVFYGQEVMSHVSLNLWNKKLDKDKNFSFQSVPEANSQNEAVLTAPAALERLAVRALSCSCLMGFCLQA